MADETGKFKENAGAVASLLLVAAFTGIGYLQMTVAIMHGAPITIHDGWMAAMLSLASAGLGYLIGRHSTKPLGYSQDEYDAALAAPPPGPPPGEPPCPDCPPSADATISTPGKQGD